MRWVPHDPIPTPPSGRSRPWCSWAVLFQLLQKSGDYVWAGLEVGIMRRIGADAFARVQRYSSDWHADTFAGATVRNITRGMWAFDMLGDALYFHLGPSVAITVGRRGADDLALAADGPGVPGRRTPLHGGLGQVVAGLRRPAPARGRRIRQPRRRGAGRRPDLQRRGQEHGRRGSRGRPSGRHPRHVAGQHAALLVRVDPYRRRAERDSPAAARPCWSAGRCGCGRSVGPVPATSPTCSPAS